MTEQEDETSAAIDEALKANQVAPTDANPGDRVRLTIESTVQPNGYYVGKVFHGSGHDAETTFEVLRPAFSVRAAEEDLTVGELVKLLKDCDQNAKVRYIDVDAKERRIVNVVNGNPVDIYESTE